METENPLALQIKRLLSGMSDQGLQHLAEIEADLAQTGFLLDEAIAKLGASFMAIHETVRTQQEMIGLLISQGVLAADNTASLHALSDETGRHVNAAITGLQFQDLTSQLIGHSLKRIGGLREMLAALGCGGSAMHPESGSEEMVGLLNGINALLAAQNTELDGVLWKPVDQKHMESGDIELF
ncbi:MAG: chemotaxis protein [Herminiimonas sp.]|nr:chemotaxis protein [Herminiimonas sp.]